jgi:hypothetical protein
MGRTVPTFTGILDSELASWSKFRRGLRREDQEAFDDLFRAAKIHLAENFYAMRTIPFESIAVSMLLEQQKCLRQLRHEVAELTGGRPLPPAAKGPGLAP